MTGLHQFHAACIAAGVDTPAPVLRGVEMLRVARDMLDVHPVDVLTLSDDDVRARVVDLSIRAHGVAPRLGSGGLEPGVNEFESDVIAQVREAMADSIEEMTVGLQPAFDKAAAPLVDAVSKYGFTYQTTSDEVIGLGDTKAVDAWRACRAAWAQLQPIANLRRMLSEVFTVSPTATEIRDLYVLLPEGVITGNQVNWSIAFAAGDNWSLEIGDRTGTLGVVAGLVRARPWRASPQHPGRGAREAHGVPDPAHREPHAGRGQRGLDDMSLRSS